MEKATRHYTTFQIIQYHVHLNEDILNLHPQPVLNEHLAIYCWRLAVDRRLRGRPLRAALVRTTKSSLLKDIPAFGCGAGHCFVILVGWGGG